jgi:hypothetical protein
MLIGSIDQDADLRGPEFSHPQIDPVEPSGPWGAECRVRVWPGGGAGGRVAFRLCSCGMRYAGGGCRRPSVQPAGFGRCGWRGWAGVLAVGGLDL